MVLLAPSVRGQSRELLEFSLKAYDDVLATLAPGQDTIRIGDMLMDVGEARDLRDKVKARLEGRIVAQGAFDLTNKQWPNGVVPYAYDKTMPESAKTLFEAAIREWQENASLNFVTRSSEANYLLIKFTGYTNGAPMNSFVGMRGKAQDLNVAGWGNKTDCAHELGHALGMAHEQCRSDRDRFVTLIVTNLSINPATDVNYAIVPGSINRTDYDFDSLMHYPRNASAKNSAFPTMLAKSPNEKWTDGKGPEEIGQKTHLSAGDKAAMAAHYGAPLQIAGRVVDAAGNPLTGVQVTLSGGATYRGTNPIYTDAEGKYAFGGLPRKSGTYTVAVAQPSISFTESSRIAVADTASHENVNFTAIDSAPPELMIDVPAVSGVYASTPQASGKASDTVGLKEVRVALARTSDLVWWNWNENAWGTATFDWAKNVRVATGKATWTAALPNLAVGGYQLHVQSVDIADNASPWRFRHFFVDPEPPVVAVMQPVPGSTIQEFNQLRGTASDGAGTGIKDGKVYFTIYQEGDFWTGFNWKSNTDAQDPEVLLSADVVDGQWIYNAVPGQDHHSGTGDGSARHGTHFVSLFARDNAGNVSRPVPGVNSVEFTVDHSPPSVSIISPADGSTVTNLVSISGTANDSKSLETVRLYIYRFSDGQFWDGNAWGGGGSAILPVTINPNDGTWRSSGNLPSISSRNPATRLSNGGYNIMAFAVDSAGNQTRSDVVVTVEYYPEVVFDEGSYRDNDPNNNNQNWDNPANWNLGFVPGAEDIAVIGLGSPTFSGTKIVHALKFSGGEIRGGKLVIPRDGTMTWSRGTLSADLTIEEFGKLVFAAGDKTVASGRRIEMNGESEWQGTSSLSGSGASFFANNGTIRASGEMSFLYYNNGVSPIGTFENRGTLIKSGPGVLRFGPDYGGWILTNGGTLNIAEGVMQVQNQTYLGGTISGAGRLVSQDATLHLESTMTLEGGTVELKAGRLVGGGTFDGNGTFLWSGGSLEGDITAGPNTHVAFSGGDRVIASGARLRNRGALKWEAGVLATSGQSRLENSGTIEISGSVVASYYNNGVNPRGEFENTGVVTVNNGAAVRFASDYGGLHFNNRDGEVRIVDGTLTLGGGGVNSNAVYNVERGVLELVPGERHFFAGQIQVRGAGRVRVGGAALTGENAAIAIAAGATFEHASGAAEGSYVFSGPGTFVWSGGTLNAAVQWSENLNVQISGSEEKNLEAGRIVQAGKLLWSGSGGLRAVGGAEFRNTGVFEMQNDAAFYYYNNGVSPRGRFVNNGTMRKSGGVGATKFLPDYGGWEFSNNGTIDIQSGSLELNVGVTFDHQGRFMGAGSTRIVGATATVMGTNNLSGGTLELANGTLASENGRIEGTGTLLWSGGTIVGTVNAAVTNLNLRGPADKVIASGSTLRNFGGATWSGAGPMRFTGASFLENRGRFEVLEDTALFYYNNGVSPRGAVINSGSFIKSGGTNAARFFDDYGGTLFDNTGRIVVQSGSLQLGGGGTWLNGSVEVSSGAELRLFSGGYRLGGNNSFAGQTILTGGELNMMEGTNSFAANSTLLFANGALTGSGTFAGPGTFGWSGGSIAGNFNILPGTTWELQGDAEKRLATGTINNFGAAYWSGSGPFKAEGAALVNNHGTFTLLNDSGFTYYNNGVYPRGRFHNAGTLRKTSSGESVFHPDYGGWQFSNTGTIEVASGVLSLRTENALTNSVIRGAGKVRVDGGAVILAGSTTLDGGRLELASGYIDGLNTFAGSGSVEWTGGELRGTQTIAAGCTMNLDGAAEKPVAGSSTLINNGTVRWAGTGQIRGIGQSRVINNGLMIAASDGAFGYYNNGVNPVGAFENNGTFRKSGSSGRTSFLRDYGGWRFVNAGTIDLESGILEVGERFEGTPASRLMLHVAGGEKGSGYGALEFPVNAKLSGALQVLLATNYFPATNVTFNLVSYPGHDGEFATSLPSVPAGRSWKLEYLANRLELSLGAALTASNGGAAKLGNGAFQLTLTGSPGAYALFQGSTNLIDWTDIDTNRPFTGEFRFSDPKATNRAGFYRTVIMP